MNAKIQILKTFHLFQEMPEQPEHPEIESEYPIISSSQLSHPVRHHDPTKPFTRNKFEHFVLWFFEVLVLIGFYYMFAEEAGGGLIDIYFLSNTPERLTNFQPALWLSVWLIFVLSKIFKRSAVIPGAIIAEILVQLFHFHTLANVQWVLVGFIGFASIILSIKPYKGGEYYRGGKIAKQLLIVVGMLVGYMPILFFGIQFAPNDWTLISEENARYYIVLLTSINVLIVILPYWITLFLMDRVLSRNFPLTDQEQAELEKSRRMDQYADAGMDELGFLMPKPGEYFSEVLTHHPLEDDDHTIVIKLGKVRVYLCTRCTAMILGVMIALLYSKIFLFDFFYVNLSETESANIQGIFFWSSMIMALFPLTDWGLQALYIRPAKTWSRLVSGFMLGLSMHFLAFTPYYYKWVLVMLIVYFSIFAVLMFLRKKLGEKRAVKQAINEQFGNTNFGIEITEE